MFKLNFHDRRDPTAVNITVEQVKTLTAVAGGFCQIEQLSVTGDRTVDQTNRRGSTIDTETLHGASEFSLFFFTVNFIKKRKEKEKITGRQSLHSDSQIFKYLRKRNKTVHVE